MRGVELTFFFSCVYCEFLKEVFIYMTDKVFFFAKCLVADLIDFIYNLLNIVCAKISCSKGTFNKATF